MADYWKSNAKKFCEICKVWFADNKISIDNHERGLKHKGMLQARLREISKKTNETERANEKLASTLMQMEQAAIVSMNGGIRPSTGPEVGPSPRGTAMPKIERKSEYEEAKAKVRAEKEKIKQLKRTAKQSSIWQDDDQSSEGHQQGEAYSTDHWYNYPSVSQDFYTAAPPPPPESIEKEPPVLISSKSPESQNIQWVEVADETGRKYYFNIQSKETRWDAPSSFYTMEQYQESCSTSAASVKLDKTSYDASVDPSNESHVPIPQKLSSTEPKSKKSRWCEDNTGVSLDKTLEDVKPEPVFYQEEKSETTSTKNSSAGGLLGPWVPVERKEEPVIKHEPQPDVILNDLPEEASQVRDVQPTFDELEEADLKFEERKAPIISTGKKSKVVEFKKRKTVNRNVRAREEF